MNYNLIRDLMKQKKISIRKVCQQIEVTESGLWKMLKNETLQVSVLEKIANALEVPVSLFFNETGRNQVMSNTAKTGGISVQANGDNNKHFFTLGEQEREISYLKEIIKLQNELIDRYKSEKERQV